MIQTKAALPGLRLVIELTKDDPHTDWLVHRVDSLCREAMHQGVRPATLIAVLASTLGFAIGHGARSTPILAQRSAKALEETILLTESIMEDSAEDAFKKA